jgi:hypothetical protein
MNKRGDRGLTSDERQQVLVQPMRVGQVQPMRGVLVDGQARVRDQRRGLAAGPLDGEGGVMVALDDQCRHVDIRQLGSKVGLDTGFAEVDDGFHQL